MENNFCVNWELKQLKKMEMKKIGFSLPFNFYSIKLHLVNNSYLLLLGISCLILFHISEKSDLLESKVGLSEL